MTKTAPAPKQLSTRARFLQRVEEFLVDHDMAPSRFGTLACSDPRFVLDLRRGRRVNPDLMDRIDDFMVRALDEAKRAA